ncbi:MAG: OmpA family protein [Nitrospinae bacterium]|nr:OmpA family protein [Nitrospinota bacterium]
MARRKRAPKPPDIIEQEDWLVTYADAVTLLMAFFVMLLSFSELDPTKFKKVVEGISDGFNKEISPISKDIEQSAEVQTDKTMTDIKKKIDSYAKDNKVTDQIQTIMDPNGLKIINNDPYLFKPGQAELSKHSRYFIRQMTQVLGKLPFAVRVQGYTDNVPIKSDKFNSNWSLSSARAIGVIMALEKNGIPGKRFVAEGYGPYRPIASNQSEKGRALNRRIVFLIEKNEMVNTGEQALKLKLVDELGNFNDAKNTILKLTGIKDKNVFFEMKKEQSLLKRLLEENVEGILPSKFLENVYSNNFIEYRMNY